MTGQSSPLMWLADMNLGQRLDLDHRPGKDELVLTIQCLLIHWGLLHLVNKSESSGTSCQGNSDSLWTRQGSTFRNQMTRVQERDYY